MRPNVAKLAVALAAGLLGMTPVASRGQACNTGGPVLARPIADAGTSEFTFQIPMAPPSIPPGFHWSLVDDYPEEPDTASIRTGLINLSPSTTKTELYFVANPAQAGANLVFTSCAIRAQLLVNGPGTTTIHLLAKQGANVIEGPEMYLGANYPQEYQGAPMRLNPNNASWTSADLSSGTTIIGLRNDPSGNWGVGIASIVLVCE